MIAKRFNITQMLQYNNHNHNNNSNARQWRSLFSIFFIYFYFFYFFAWTLFNCETFGKRQVVIILGVELADKYKENVMVFFFSFLMSVRLKKKGILLGRSIISHRPGGLVN